MKNNILLFRKARGWSQEKLGALINSSGPQIDRLEKGNRRLTQSWMERLAAAFDIQPADLIADPARIDFSKINEPPSTGTKLSEAHWREYESMPRDHLLGEIMGQIYLTWAKSYESAIDAGDLPDLVSSLWLAIRKEGHKPSKTEIGQRVNDTLRAAAIIRNPPKS